MLLLLVPLLLRKIVPSTRNAPPSNDISRKPSRAMLMHRAAPCVSQAKSTVSDPLEVKSPLLGIAQTFSSGITFNGKSIGGASVGNRHNVPTLRPLWDGLPLV